MELKKLRELAEGIMESDASSIRNYQGDQDCLTGPALLGLVESAETLERILRNHAPTMEFGYDKYGGIMSEDICTTCGVLWPCPVVVEAEPLSQWEIDLMRGTND